MLTSIRNVMLYSCHFDKTELKIMIFINFQVYHRNEKNFESLCGLGGRHLKIRQLSTVAAVDSRFGLYHVAVVLSLIFYAVSALH